MRFNPRLAAHLLFAGLFTYGSHPLVTATDAKGRTITVALCSQPGVMTSIEIPVDGKPPRHDDGAKPCHATCCTRRGDSGADDDSSDN